MNHTTPAIAFPGKIHLIIDDRGLETAAPLLFKATELGFDTETRPSFRKGEFYNVALLQLATETDAFLIRLQKISIYHDIKSILENKNVLKVGVAIRDDLKALNKMFPFQPGNFVELQDVAKAKGLNNFGLKGMTEEVLNARLSKGPKTTNWEAKELTEIQLMYAATDAWIGLKLHEKIKGLPNQPKPQ